jgi:hypothetical protein
MKKQSDNRTLFFSDDRMAEILGMTKEALKNYAEEGSPRESDKRYYSPRVVEWLLLNANPATKIYPRER